MHSMISFCMKNILVYNVLRKSPECSTPEWNTVVVIATLAGRVTIIFIVFFILIGIFVIF